MEGENHKDKKNVIIVLTVVSIIIFIIFIVLFATGAINLKSNKINSNTNDNSVENNDSDNAKSCKYDTGIEEYDKELYDYFVKNNVCGGPVYISKDQLPNYGFGESITLENIDEFTNYLVSFLHSSASFDDVSRIDKTVLFNLLSHYLNNGDCAWYKKSLYIDAFKYIFGEKEYDIESLISEHAGYETDNFVQLCNGIGSVVSTQLEDKKEDDNRIIYNYNAQFYPIDENKNSYTITVEYEKSNEHHYLNKISIIEK